MRRTSAEAIARPGSQVLLGEREGALIACCHIERQGAPAYFGMFAVNPTARAAGGQAGAGRGRAYRARAVALPMDGHDRIVQRDELIAWYERRGYARTGQYRPFPDGDERFGVPRRDDLRFELLGKPLAGVAA